MKFKTCRKCGRELTIDDFYSHSLMADGHLNICKDCVKTRVIEYRAEHIDQIRAYDRSRDHNPKRQKNKNKITAKRRNEVIGYERCHNAIQRAIKKGEIQRSNTCQVCGKQGKTEAHHNDYLKPKEVIWLCHICHRGYHLGKTERAESVRKIIDLLLKIQTAK